MSKLRKEHLCIDCPHLQGVDNDKCQLGVKFDCPYYMSTIADWVLTNKWLKDDYNELIPIESIVEHLRKRGYTGELRKTTVKTV